MQKPNVLTALIYGQEDKLHRTLRRHQHFETIGATQQSHVTFEEDV